MPLPDCLDFGSCIVIGVADKDPNMIGYTLKKKKNNQ